MKAPNKIYCGDNGHGNLSFSTTKVYDSMKEYIRKDYLLEWLDGKLTIEGATEGYVGGYDSALKDVIEKLNEM